MVYFIQNKLSVILRTVYDTPSANRYLDIFQQMAYVIAIL